MPAELFVPVRLRDRPRCLVRGDWVVTSLAVGPADVSVTRANGAVWVTVSGGAGAGRTRVVLGPDGTLTVHARATPPALLVDSRSARTLPAVPGLPETTRFDTGHRLLVLSCDAFDALPASLAHVLQALPEQVTGREPAALLTELFADLPGGSGVIVARRPALRPVTGPDHEEAPWESAQRS